jgi:hypothetical protein
MFEPLLETAGKIIAEGFAGAKLVHARGVPKSGTAQVLEDFSRFHFVFMRPSNYVTIDWDGDNMGTPIQHDGLWAGDQPIRPPFPKDLAAALAALRQNGRQDALSKFDLRMPLHPSTTEPLYIFTLAGSPVRLVGVGAETGAVTDVQTPG